MRRPTPQLLANLIGFHFVGQATFINRSGRLGGIHPLDPCFGRLATRDILRHMKGGKPRSKSPCGTKLAADDM
jgi:hypothetical protein